PLERRAALDPDDVVVAEPALVERILDEVEVGRVAFGSAGVGVLDGAGTGERSIELPYLQLVLARLWDEERRDGSHVLRLETLERLGGAERIVRTHLDVALDALDPDDQEVAAAVFRYLVTPSGTKIAHRVDDLAEYAGHPPAAGASRLAPASTPEGRASFGRSETTRTRSTTTCSRLPFSTGARGTCTPGSSRRSTGGAARAGGSRSPRSRSRSSPGSPPG